MPEFLGFRMIGGQIVAIVNYPKARRFTLMPANAPQANLATQKDEEGKRQE